MTGPEWGNSQLIAPRLWASVEPAMALTVDVDAPPIETESPYWAGNIQGANGSPVSIEIYLEFIGNWSNTLVRDGLTAPEVTELRNVVRVAVEKAFTSYGYDVKAILGTLEPSKQHKYRRRVEIVDLTSGINGETYSGPLFSTLHMGSILRSFVSAFDCDAAGTPCRNFDEMVQKSGYTRGSLINALGRGTGATAAHEFGHQVNTPVGVSDFVYCSDTCETCYDYTRFDQTKRFPRAYFLAQRLQWSPQAEGKMRKILPWKRPPQHHH